MSALAIQRAIVRMLLDPRFCDAVYADPARALADAGLTAEEQGWLVRPDRRAYATDRWRGARTLAALGAELPAAFAWARAESRVVEDFLASDDLHACIAGRGVLVAACARWLGREAGPALATLVALEAAVARARRGVRLPDGPWRALAPRAAVVTVPDGALTWWEAVRTAAAAGAPLPAPAPGEPTTVLLAVDEAGAVAGEVLPEGLVWLRDVATTPAPREALVAIACRYGLDPDEALWVIDGLVDDGLLVAAPAA